MSDFFSLGTPGNAQGDVASGAAGVRLGTSLDTGKLRRKFNFGDRVSELSLMQDPFFRMVSAVAKRPTDDPSFKFTEKRPSWHKRYAYGLGHYVSGTIDPHDSQLDKAGGGAATAAGDVIELAMATDYKSSGNVQNVYGSSTSEITVGGTGTRPAFFLPGQLIKIPVGAVNASGPGTPTDFHVARINTVVTDDQTSNMGTDNDSMEVVKVNASIVKFAANGANELAGFKNNAGWDTDSSVGSDTVYDQEIAGTLEGYRTYVIGTAFGEGTGYPETWKDQPYSTGYGQTQIWKTAMAMNNTARATQLKYEQNEWARIWKEKLVEHKWDIEHSLLFGSQYTDSSGIQYTQGCIDFVSQYGNAFSLDINTKTQDDFLDDLSNYIDPRYNNSKATVFFCSTAVYNWLHKLGGYFSNNLEISPNYRADFAISGKKKLLGVDATVINTVYGDMNIVRDIHLDGTNIKMLGVNMKYCAYRPLVGNGLNRDTSVYVGVQTLENSGVDRRVDLILTEAGMEWQMPECHAIWT